MSKGIRVNQLAKELGVESKAILARCRDEGLGEKVPNHMSVLSLGLAKTVREWFAGGGGVATAFESAPAAEDDAKTKPVRKTIQRKPASEAPAEAAPATEPPPIAVVETPAAIPEVPKPVAPGYLAYVLGLVTEPVVAEFPKPIARPSAVVHPPAVHPPARLGDTRPALRKTITLATRHPPLAEREVAPPPMLLVPKPVPAIDAKIPKPVPPPSGVSFPTSAPGDTRAATALDAPSSEGSTYSCLVVDGLNVIWCDGRARLEALLIVLVDLLPRTKDLLCICDANTRYVLREYQSTRHSEAYLELLNRFRHDFFESPAGTQADDFILSEAKKRDGVVVSNDMFDKYKLAHPWVNSRERFIRIKVIRETLYVGRSEHPQDRSLDALLEEFDTAYKTRTEGPAQP